MKRIHSWSSWLLAAAGLIGVLAAIGWMVIFSQSEAWKAKGLDALNQNIAGEVIVQRVDLSWWNGFPNVSIDFHDVAVVTEDQDTVLRAERLGLELNLWSVVQQEPEITSAFLEHGMLHVRPNRLGQWNIETLVAERSEETDSVAVVLSAMTIEDVEFLVEHPQENWAFQSQLERLVLKGGNNKPWDWDMDMTEGLWVDQSESPLNPMEWTGGGTLDMGADITVQGRGALQGIDAEWVLNVSESWTLRLEAEGVGRHDLERLMTLPLDSKDVVLNHKAQVEINAQPDDVLVNWTLPENGFQLAPKFTGLSMAVHGVCAGSGFVRQSHGAMDWGVERMDISGSGWQVEGALTPRSQGNLHFQGQAQLDATVPLQSWIPDIDTDWLQVWPNMGLLQWDGELSWNPSTGTQNVHGTAAMVGWAGSLDGQPYQLDAPELRFDNGLCEASGIRFVWAGNECVARCEAVDAGSFVNGNVLSGRLSLDANQIMVDAILKWWEHVEREGEPGTSILPSGSKLLLDLSADNLRWDGLTCTDVSAQGELLSDRLSFDKLAFDALEGHASLNGEVKPGLAGWALDMQGKAEDVALQKLFKTYENFGQTMIRQEHLRGAVSTEGTLLMSWGLDGSWHGEHLTASLHTQINQGELIGLEVFDDIADYLSEHRLIAPLVDPEDLRQRLKSIEFNPVSQLVEVRQEQVLLPMTVIESSAMNVAIEGVYGFDDVIDYTLGFALRDLRATASDAFGEMEDDGLGNQFFLKMEGPVSSPSYRYDRDAAKKHRKEAIQAEKDRLKQAWQERRGGEATDSDAPKEKEAPKEKPNNWRTRFIKSQEDKDAELFDDDDDYF